MRLYLIDTDWACAGVETLSGVVEVTAPIFSCFLGQRIDDLKKHYKVQYVETN